ncbi:MAG: sugar phosphate nucleotidyltransferase, partial [Desulfobacterales bacterium]|nr:sugar phosphate nucleotidyltransferase [Desulfobacterales bacterium]
DYVLILSGDHIYKMDYKRFLQYHEEKGADITISLIEVPVESAHQFGVAEVDDDFRIQAFQEKPKADIKILEKFIVCLSDLADNHPEIHELDINPLLVHPEGKGATVADCRIILKAPETQPR